MDSASSWWKWVKNPAGNIPKQTSKQTNNIFLNLDFSIFIYLLKLLYISMGSSLYVLRAYNLYVQLNTLLSKFFLKKK